MYSGTTFRIKSGRIMGTHQRIDRVAKRQITPFVPKSIHFPTIHDILHFEGLNGPDGIKRKSPGYDEPWHFINPRSELDSGLITVIHEHIHNLAVALRAHDDIRAAFEAAWLSHAITDALTPAHHYPLEEKLRELRGGEGLETRNSKRAKIIIPGKTIREQLRNNWEFWGTKGVMTTHFAFELGVATTIAPHNLDRYDPLTQANIDSLGQHGFDVQFREILTEVAGMNMYEEFIAYGWTQHLAKETRSVLIPRIVKAVSLGWYAAILDAERLS